MGSIGADLVFELDAFLLDLLQSHFFPPIEILYLCNIMLDFLTLLGNFRLECATLLLELLALLLSKFWLEPPHRLLGLPVPLLRLRILCLCLLLLLLRLELLHLLPLLLLLLVNRLE